MGGLGFGCRVKHSVFVFTGTYTRTVTQYWTGSPVPRKRESSSHTPLTWCWEMPSLLFNLRETKEFEKKAEKRSCVHRRWLVRVARTGLLVCDRQGQIRSVQKHGVRFGLWRSESHKGIRGSLHHEKCWGASTPCGLCSSRLETSGRNPPNKVLSSTVLR